MRLEVGSMNGKPLLRIFGDHGPPDSGLLDFDLLPPGIALGHIRAGALPSGLSRDKNRRGSKNDNPSFHGNLADRRHVT
jgi:hypothetical protein